MSQFDGFNAENKLRIPLSAYAAQIIDTDCFNFSKKKTTLINTIIINSYKFADSSISLRLKEYKDELETCLNSSQKKDATSLIKNIIDVKAEELINKYTKRYAADVNWQITLSKKTKKLLTEDKYSSEELYYGKRPGHYVRAILEEYALKPHNSREKIVFKDIFDAANISIDGNYKIRITNNKGNQFLIKPYKIMTDPLSMHHYLVGINASYENSDETNETELRKAVISLRISKLINAEPEYLSDGKLSEIEQNIILDELKRKGVQFVTSEQQSITIWLSDEGIRKYETMIHLRPSGMPVDESNKHIYRFECTDSQILFYFWRFGKDAKIINPPELANKFMEAYKEAYESYDNRF